MCCLMSRRDEDGFAYRACVEYFGSSNKALSKVKITPIFHRTKELALPWRRDVIEFRQRITHAKYSFR